MGFFSENSKFMQFMGRLVDVLLLNLLWLVFCLPLVTIGAATVAAFSVTLKMVDDEEGYIARNFVKAFRDNFRKSTIVWLLNALVLYALYIDVQIIIKADNPPLVLIIVGIISAFFIFFAFIYAYPQIARYENKIKATLENSVRICFRFPGRTGLLLGILALELGLFVWNTYMMLFGVLVGPMLIIYTISGISKRIFQDIDRQNQG